MAYDVRTPWPFAETSMTMLLGIDFSSAPSRKKPIAVITAQWQGAEIHLLESQSLLLIQDMTNLLLQTSPFVAAIDMPFGLSRELVDGLKWPGHGRYTPQAWADLMRYYSALEGSVIRATFKAWCDARPAGKKFAHRACDGPAGSSPSMKWVNPPVAIMLQRGVPCLMQAGVHIPGMQIGDPNRVAIEAYPGYLARQVLQRQSYKSDDPKKDTPDRRLARSELLCAMEEGMVLGIRVRIPDRLRHTLLEDAKADHLDAALCAVVAGWCAKRSDLNHGLPPQIDPVEGWIAPVPWQKEAKAGHKV